MTQYLTGLTEAQARAYQRGLYMLTRPAPNPADGTLYFDAAIPHPENDTYCVRIDPAAPIKVNAAADSRSFDMGDEAQNAAWQAFLDEINVAEWQALAAKIDTGGSFVVGDFIPSNVLAQLITQEAAELLGFVL